MLRPKRWLFAALLIALPVVLILLPADYFNKGQSICISILLFNTECYGCGMTRAIMHLIHADFSAAWEFNNLSYLVLPLLIMLYIKISAWVFFQKKILKWF